MRRGHLAAILLVAAAMSPGIYLRDPPSAGLAAPRVAFEALAAPKRAGPFAVVGAWRMTGQHFWFGSYSALVALDDGTLLAGSDRGWTLRFAPPGDAVTPPMFAPFEMARKRRLIDLEALARDPATGAIWAAFENNNVIARKKPDGAIAGIAPLAMRNWPLNGGAEAMARLPDGRFVVLAEATGAAGRHPALLFPRDPLAGGAPLEFAYGSSGGFVPVDMAALPDGRVLVLERRVAWRLPPGFAGRVVLADPASIRAGATWRGKVLADLAPPMPTDNYEGIAAIARPDGSVAVWLISDDNRMAIQRTLLLALSFRP